jgi:hypothetical protein
VSLQKCNDPQCQRWIDESIFDTASAHGLGCKVRRSLNGKVAFEAKQKRIARARKAAATRAARRAQMA